MCSNRRVSNSSSSSMCSNRRVSNSSRSTSSSRCTCVGGYVLGRAGGGAFVHARVCVYLCAHVTVCLYVEQKMEEQ